MIIDISWILIGGVYIALLTVFILILAYKWGLVEYLQVHGNEFFSRMANCDFCMSWWVGVIIAVIMAMATYDVMWLYTPFVSTPIARRLV